MEWITLLLIVLIIFILIKQKNELSANLSSLENELFKLREQLKGLSQVPKPEEKPTLQEAPATPKTPKQDYWESGFQRIEEDIAPSAPLAPREIESQQKPVTMEPTLPISMLHSPEGPKAGAPSPIPPQETVAPGFFESHPDLEKFIGENIISKIGIGVLVLAIGFFVKFAIDNNWIGPVGRVGIGLICGGILTGLAHYLHKSYKAFSSILVGGGLAVFYFTIALAFHQYQLFNQMTAFVIMVIITAFAVLLSLLYDRQELAIISLVGGFSTPFMVSNGSNDYQALFTYLLILNIGLLAIAYRKSWRLLNLLAFIFTVVLMGSWILTLPTDTPPVTYSHGFVFATLFYILFFIVNLAHNVKENKKFIASDFGILLANTSLYFAVGYFFLEEMQRHPYQGLFCASMAFSNLLISYLLFRLKKVDTNILYLLIGITLSFISLTAPIQLHGHYITLFWATESVLLFWLFLKSGIRLMAITSLIVWIAMLVSLLMDLVDIYEFQGTLIPVVFNKGFITMLFASIGTFCLMILKKKQDEMENQKPFIYPTPSTLFTVGTLLLFLSGALEINHQFTSHYPGTELNLLYLWGYFFAFSWLFIIGNTLFNRFWKEEYSVAILSSCAILYLIGIFSTLDIQEQMLEKHQFNAHFATHWISALLLCLIIFRLISLFRHKIQAGKFLGLVTVCLSTFVVIFLSTEIYLLVNGLYQSNLHPVSEIQRVYIKSGLPILWSLCSFGMMWIGMHFKFKTLRILGLSLFFITLVKLFFYDIQNIPVAGKIAAFFCLGVLLLVVSFMYQRLKKIIIDEEKNTP